MTPTYTVTVASTGAFVPFEPIGNDDLEKLCGALPADVLEGIQVQRRHWMIDPRTGEHRISNSRMALAAVEQALERAGIEPQELELLVVCTASPDYHLPNVATMIQSYLGLERCATIELRAGCAGAVQALDVAHRLLAAGMHRNAVVVGSEAISPIIAPIYLDSEPDRIRMRDRLTLFTFGDGAGAIALTATEGEPRQTHFVNSCIGGLRSPGMQVIGGGTDISFREQRTRKKPVEMKIDVPGTSTFGPKVFAAALSDVLSSTGLHVADFAHIVLPEGNAGYFNRELADAGISESDYQLLQGRIVENLADVGATGSAAVPLSLDAGVRSSTVTDGDRILLLGIEASRYVYSGLVLDWNSAP
ncbi:3-oxoacyl-ACP synthase III family protein [Nocardia sp. BSTN01]|uniref:3-oxoacyl-ACP synthase III family protein n=1 Tax=Nocardia sp. BSTN01 TaxID=2783665 RepID=UPI00188F9C12|nr:3-oxoacyl-ACP synthase III family protein [Nocardia sp. BSTN01]MBF5002323.1 3-oxoacyl-ACP synthase III family protein [Nocardia sp. BSTN01]